MHINTKVVFEWDQDKQEYLEVYSEGYEYSGDVDLAAQSSDAVNLATSPGQEEEEDLAQDPFAHVDTSPYSGPTGYQGYQSLWDLSLGKGEGLADYLENEFGIGTDYEQYIRPFENKPFELLEAGLGLEQKGLRTATTTGLGEAGRGASTAYAQSNLVNVGGITQGFEQQKDKLTAAYGFDMEQAQLGYETDVYGEQKTQEERFYDDIQDIIQMKAGEEEPKPKCCFIVLEVEEKNGLSKDVRQYRDEMMNDQNRSGYYKLAQVVVPLMRKSKLIKRFFKYFFVKPAKSWAKWYYHKKGIGWIFEPLRRFWLGLFTYLGKEHELRVDNE